MCAEWTPWHSTAGLHLLLDPVALGLVWRLLPGRFWMTEAQSEVLVEPETFAEARESPLGELQMEL